MVTLKFGSILALASAAGAILITQSQVDLNRNGANASETVLTPVTVASGGFQKAGSLSVDGAVYAQPLYADGVTVGGASHSVVIVSTMHDSVYAFDVNCLTCSPLWTVSVGTSRTSFSNPVLYGQEMGCLSTGVIDSSLTYLYEACTTNSPSTVLVKIALATGAIVTSTTITGSVSGTGDPQGGDCVTGGTLTMCAQWHINRAGLVLANGNVYIGFGSINDDHPWHGWLYAYNASTLSQVAVFCVVPNGYGGAIWQSGGAPAVDGSGNLYVSTGNGDYDGVNNFGLSVIKLSPSLAVLDWWTPSNWAALEAADLDLTGKPMLIPGTALVVAEGKDRRVFSINTACMGHLQGGGSSCAAPQIFNTDTVSGSGDVGINGAMFMGSTLFLPTVGDPIYAFSLSGSTFNTTPTKGASSYAYPGAQMSGSSNAGANGIIWAITFQANSEESVQAATLRAINASSLAEIWNSGTRNGDAIGNGTKFVPPTVAAGKVFVATHDNAVQVFGLVPSTQVSGQVTVSGGVTIH